MVSRSQWQFQNVPDNCLQDFSSVSVPFQWALSTAQGTGFTPSIKTNSPMIIAWVVKIPPWKCPHDSGCVQNHQFPTFLDSCGCLKRPVSGQHSLRADLVARPRRCDMMPSDFQTVEGGVCFGFLNVSSHPLGYKEWTIMPKINCLLNWPWVDIYIYIFIYEWLYVYPVYIVDTEIMNSILYIDT